MLPQDPDSTPQEEYQYLLHQLKVWNKLCVQLSRLKHSNREKYTKGLDLMLQYGMVLSKDFDTDLDKDLALAYIFEQARDFVG